MATQIDIVLVGYRPGALHAASRLGLRTLLVDDKPPSEAAQRRIQGSVCIPVEQDPEASAAAIHEALDGSTPRAVVATGERRVLEAAHLRARLGLPGIDPATALTARDKPQMKARVRAAGVRCTDWAELDPTTSAQDLMPALGLPLVLKRRDGCGTAGLVRARTEAEVADALASLSPEARPHWMAERFVHGNEMSVESFVHQGRILFVNPTEYYVPGFSSIAPAALAETEREAVCELNAAALAALGLTQGMTHLELYRTEEGPVFGEVAVRPPGGRLMRLLRRAYGFDPWETVIQLELGGAPPDLPASHGRVAGVWMLYPGPGRVVSARGFAAARRVKGVRKLVCRTRAGRVLEPRGSTGRDVGWIEVSGRSRDQVAERLEAAHGRIHFEMEPLGTD